MAIKCKVGVLLSCLIAFARPVSSSEQYHGELIGTFSDTTSYAVAGSVYAVDDDTIRIVGFTYDGRAPDAFVWGSETTTTPSGEGFIIGSSTKLPEFNDEVMDFDLPAGRSVTSLKYVSIWCRQAGVSFNHVLVPGGLVAPAEHSLGALVGSSHAVSATDVVILNHKQIRFYNLFYDGGGPDAFFWGGAGDTPSISGFIIPDESDSVDILGSFTDQTVTVTLPRFYSVFDIGHIGIWCRRFRVDFGHIDIPSEGALNIPPAPLDVTGRLLFPHCESLVDDEFQVHWLINGNDLYVQLQTVGVDSNEYAAFGVSGSATGTQMIGGDVVVTFVDDSGQGQAIDYYLHSQAQCSSQNGQGACPDTIASASGTNDATLCDFSIEDGITSVIYSRPLGGNLDATTDEPISTSAATYVIWARGSISGTGLVSYHQDRLPPSSNLQINFGSTESSSCTPLPHTSPEASPMTGVTEQITQPPLNHWVIPQLVARESATFIAEMGQSGGQIGYEAITGQIGWGIAWFINETLIPELVVERGQTYTFLVSGGDDPATSASYHPFYITDDPDGGYAQLSASEQQNIVNYVGPTEGPLCQWQIGPNTEAPETYETFEAYRATLQKDCQPGEPGVLTWTVREETPDLVYYHCYTHRYLGWKIHVLDATDTSTETPADMTTDPPSQTNNETSAERTTDSLGLGPSTLSTTTVGGASSLIAGVTVLIVTSFLTLVVPFV